MHECLTAADFESFDAGALATEGESRIREHLGACSTCQTAYDRYRSSLTIALAASSTPGSSADETQVGSLGTAARAGPRYPSIPGYRILGIAGKGGMGIVYRAVQNKLNRTVALKVLPAMIGTASPAAVTRFRKEATAAARLHHTNIIPIYDFGESLDGYYYAMELINGQSLNVVIQRLGERKAHTAPPTRLADLMRHSLSELPAAKTPAEGVPENEGESPPGAGSAVAARGQTYYKLAARWIADAADALQHAHAAGIIHRDIKPANLMLSVDGRILVADFGLAKDVSESSMTMTGALLGTLRYVSPEQAMARRVRVDHRTDIYSLGATMYELLCFQPAFPGDDQKEILGAIISSDPLSPHKVVAAVPRELETICLKALEKSADARYPSAKDFADDLRRYIGDLPISAKRPGLLQRAVKFSRRRKAVVIAGAACLALLITGCLLYASMRATGRQRTERVTALIADATEHMKSSNWKKADENLLEALREESQNKEALLYRAIVKKELFNSLGKEADPKLLAEADELCRRVLAMDPKFESALNTHGVILKKLGKMEEAVVAYTTLIGLNSSKYSAWSNLALIHAQQGDLARAEQELKTATGLTRPDDVYAADPWRNLAAIHLHAGRVSEAVVCLEEALKRNKNDIGSWLLKARTQLPTNPAEALQSAGYAQFISNGMEPRSFRLQALATLRQGRPEEAVSLVAQAESHGDELCLCAAIGALAHSAAGRPDQARIRLADAERALPAALRRPGDYVVATDRGVLWFETYEEFDALRTEARRLGDTGQD